MKIIMDLHTHTTYSHGKSTVLENARAAIKRGIKLLGICEHGPGHIIYGVKDLQPIRDDAAKISGIKVLAGYEFNIVSHHGDLDERGADLRLAGFHRAVMPKTLSSVWFVIKGSLSLKSASAQMTDAVVAAIERNEIDALTHPGEYVPVDIKEVARAAVRRGTALEINEPHSINPQHITAAAEQGAHFIISSDAHLASRIGRYDRSLALVESTHTQSRVLNADGYAFSADLRLNRLKAFLD